MRPLIQNVIKSLLLLSTTLTAQCLADVHPIVFKDDNELYNNTAFGMPITDFKSKAGAYISACQDANKSNQFADKACKIAYKTNDYGMAEALVMFKNEKLISVYHKLNNEHYEKVVKNLNEIYKENAQVEKREEKKGLFSSPMLNEYAIWSFNDYLMMVSKFDIQKYQKNGPNFLYAMESANPEFITNIKNEFGKKAKIEMVTKPLSVDLSTAPPQQSQVKINESSNNVDSLSSNNIEVKSTKTVKPNEPQENNVFGLALGQSLQIPECRKQYGIYDISNKSVCFERIFGREKLTTPVENETVQIRFPILDAPKIAKNGVLVGKVIDGKLEGVNFNTFGIKNAEQVLSKLKEKYGEPHEYKPYVEENRLGQKFNAFLALWKFDNLEVYMQSIVSSISSGLVSVDTPKAKAAKQDALKELQKDPRPL